MPRPSRPRFWESRNGGGWHVTIRGKQHFLGHHPEGSKFDPERPPQSILDQWHKLEAVELPQSRADLRVAELFDAYLASLRPELAKRYKPVLMGFARTIHRGRKLGTLLIDAELDESHLDAYLSSNKDWSRSTVSNYGTIVIGAIRWGVRRKAIPIRTNPLAGYSLPDIEATGVVVTPEEYASLRSAYGPEWTDLIDFVWFTGCRLGEAIRMTAAHVHDGVVIFEPHEHKTGRRTGDRRIIGLVPETQEIVDRLSKLYPEGPLLRNHYGKPWTDDATFRRFDRLRKQGKIRREITIKALRPSFATHAIADGRITEGEAAKALGHRSLRMIQKHYDHSRKNIEHVASIFKKARGI